MTSFSLGRPARRVTFQLRSGDNGDGFPGWGGCGVGGDRQGAISQWRCQSAQGGRHPVPVKVPETVPAGYISSDSYYWSLLKESEFQSEFDRQFWYFRKQFQINFWETFPDIFSRDSSKYNYCQGQSRRYVQRHFQSGKFLSDSFRDIFRLRQMLHRHKLFSVPVRCIYDTDVSKCSSRVVRFYNNPAPLNGSMQFHYCTLVTREPEQTTLLFWSAACGVTPHGLHTADRRYSASAGLFQICFSPLTFWPLVCLPTLCLRGQPELCTKPWVIYFGILECLFNVYLDAGSSLISSRCLSRSIPL